LATALITHAACLEHDPGPYHPESPDRLRAVLHALDAPEFAPLVREQAPRASKEQLARVHPARIVDAILAIQPDEGDTVNIDADTAMSHGSAEAALRWLEREQPDVEAAARSVERIRELGHAASRTVAGMRALSSSLPRELTERSLNALIAEAVQVSRPLIGRAEVQTELSFDSTHPIVRCEPSQMLQVLLNLIRNALDSLRETSGRQRCLVIRTFEQSGSVTAEVEDNGVGISREVAERLFNPLYTTKKDGMGLGLSICRRVMASHCGTISARPGTPFGAIFAIRLPQAPGTTRSMSSS